MHRWIDDAAELAHRLQEWRGQPRVGLDTEFIRERTYYPQLALVQLSVPGEILLADPLAPGIAAALAPLLADRGTTKIMHSASEDLQAFARGVGTLPAPLFDTQVGAAMAGLGGGLGYQKLVEAVTGVALEKGETRSDWLRRPLSDSQLRYAAEDVAHLHELHDAIEPKLRALGRLDWLRADGDDPLPHLAVRSAQTLDAAGQARLRRLLRWRDAEARRADRPKSWVLDNELAVQLSRRPFPAFAAFNAMLDANPRAPRKSRRELFELVDAPLTEEEAALPLNRAVDLDKQRLKQMQEAVAGLAGALGVPEALLCARRHLEQLLEGRGWPASLEGWRRSLLEPALAPLLP